MQPICKDPSGKSGSLKRFFFFLQNFCRTGDRLHRWLRKRKASSKLLCVVQGVMQATLFSRQASGWRFPGQISCLPSMMLHMQGVP